MSGLLTPRSIAVVGASRDQTSVGAKVLRNILEGGFRGAVYPVNPQTAETQGRKCYPSLKSIDAEVDLVVVAVPAAKVEGVLEEGIARGLKAAIVLSAGFGEVSLQGKVRQETLKRLATEGRFRLLGPNCLGMMNTDPAVSLNATFAAGPPLAGSVAVASQSGALGLMLLDSLKQRQLGISSFFSIGNRADLSSNDLLEYWEKDERSKAIVLYLESLGQPENFQRIATRVSRTKPIIMLKPGRSKAGVRAAASHSAAVIGDVRALRALFAKTGVIEATSVEHVVDLLTYFDTVPPPAGRRVGIVTNGGGPGVMLADALERGGLEVPLLGEHTQERLRTLLAEHSSAQNPIDLLPGAHTEQYEKVLRVLASDKAVDSIALMHVPLEHGSETALYRALPELLVSSGCTKPVIPVMLSATKEMRESTGCYFTAPERAASTLISVVRYEEWKSRARHRDFSFSVEIAERVRSLCRHAQQAHYPDGWLPADASERLLSEAGITHPRSEIIEPSSEPEVDRIGFPMVAKLVSAGLIHKTDVGGVICDIRNREQLELALASLAASAERSGLQKYSVLLQEEIAGAVEGFVGAVRDRECGPVVVFGLGGRLVQLIDDLAFLTPPFSADEVINELAHLRFRSLLDGYRGAEPADAGAFVDVVLRIGALVHANWEIAEIDINPLLVGRKGSGALAVDARIRVNASWHVS